VLWTPLDENLCNLIEDQQTQAFAGNDQLAQWLTKDVVIGVLRHCQVQLPARMGIS